MVKLQCNKYQRSRFPVKCGSSKYYEFTNLDTKKVSAAKIITKSSLTKSRAKLKLISEIKIHRSLHHNNIVGFEHYFEDSENVYIILELCSNQTLNEFIRRRKRLKEIEAKWCIVQIIFALKYLHSHRIIHRDLKLGNIFFSANMMLKIGEFGLATKQEFDGELNRTICGTSNYIAPEILESKKGYSYEVDIWNLGVILYTMLVGKPPFELLEVKTTYRRIRNNMYTFPDTVHISDSAKDMITKILTYDPTKRPSLDDLLMHDFLNHDQIIPRLLFAPNLIYPPSPAYIKYFTEDESSLYIKSETKVHCEEIEQDNPTDYSKEESMSARPDCRNINELKVLVKKWVDHSSKYGLGYLLSNNSYGVFFNDSTKIVLDPDGNSFIYYERRISDEKAICSAYTLIDYPNELQKKVALLQHFRGYLEGSLKKGDDRDTKNIDTECMFKEEIKVEGSTETPINKVLEEDTVYVKKWMRTCLAIVFKLSNKVVQVNFQDHTEIILSYEPKIVTYVNKKSERLTYQLSNAMSSSNMEMVKKLKYTKDILTHMLQPNQTNRAATLSVKSFVPLKKD